MAAQTGFLGTLFVFGLIMTGYWSYQAFTRRQFELEDTPTLPRYMTRRPLFLYGTAAFVVLSLGVYGLIVFYFENLLPLLESIHKPTYEFIKGVMESGPLNLPFIIVMAAAIFVTLLKIESRFNLVLVLRNLLHSWAAIPHKTAEIVSRAREALNVPEDERKAVTTDLETPFVSLGDFKKQRKSLEREWAESSYMKRWLNRQEASGRHASFFREPTLLWEQVGESYTEAAQKVGIIRNSVGNDGITSEFIEGAAKDVVAIRRSLCRLSGCFLIYQNNSENDLWDEAEKFGIPGRPVPIPNPLWRMPLFIVGVVAAVFFGCLVSAILFDVLRGDPLSQAISSNLQDGVAYRWIGYTLFAWCIPILVTLAVRYVDHRINPRTPGMHPANYAFIAIMGAIVAAASLAGAVYVLEPPNSPHQDMDLGALLFLTSRWSAGPGILCAYIAFRLDTFRRYEEAVWAVRSLCWIAACVLVVGLVSIPATFMSPAEGTWSLNKTYTVIMMTVLMIAFALASITEYVRAPASHDSQSPAGAGMESV